LIYVCVCENKNFLKQKKRRKTKNKIDQHTTQHKTKTQKVKNSPNKRRSVLTPE